MDNIYEQGKDLHVRGTYVYVKSGDAYAYSNSGKTAKISAIELKDLFLKGAVVSDGDNMYKPVGLTVSDGVATLTYVKTNTTTATTADLATLKSEEYSST